MDKIIRTIKAVSSKCKGLEDSYIGFLTEEEDQWYNVKAEESVLDEMLKTVIKKGNKIEFEIIAGIPGEFKVLEEAKSSKFEDDMVTFEQLLTKAHEMKNPFSIETEMLAIDLEKKYALFKATVKVQIKEQEPDWCVDVKFQGHGDATEDNVTGTHIKPHFIRMAETRAIVRALRWYTNNGCAEEEK